MAKIQRTSAPAQPAVPSQAPSPRLVAGLFKPLKGRTEYVRALFWGREGSGKTTAALRASRNGRILVIDSEGGLKADALSDSASTPTGSSSSARPWVARWTTRPWTRPSTR